MRPSITAAVRTSWVRASALPTSSSYCPKSPASTAARSTSMKCCTAPRRAMCVTWLRSTAAQACAPRSKSSSSGTSSSPANSSPKASSRHPPCSSCVWASSTAHRPPPRPCKRCGTPCRRGFTGRLLASAGCRCPWLRRPCCWGATCGWVWRTTSTLRRACPRPTLNWWSVRWRSWNSWARGCNRPHKHASAWASPLRGSRGPPGECPQRFEPTRRGQLFARGVRGPQQVTAGDERTARQLLEGTGFCEQEPLSGDATQRQERCDLGLVLDSFRHRVESEGLSQRDDRTRKLRPIVGVGQPAHKGTIDLQNVDREAVQVGQRRVTGAEIVDCEFDTERLQALESLQVRLGVVHGRAFGQLDDEIAGLESGFTQRLRDIVHQLAVLQVAARNVHGQP